MLVVEEDLHQHLEQVVMEGMLVREEEAQLVMEEALEPEPKEVQVLEEEEVEGL